jgi:RNA polymerase sigma factor (sigma-70 family)
MLIDTDAPPVSDRESVDGAALVAAHLPEIDRAIAFVSRQRRLSRDASQELASDVYLRLLRHDGAVLRSYRGESSLGTFLVVVIQRTLLDAHIARTGKWHPSATAKRLGRVAILLERLMFRDGLTFPEAAAVVREKLGVADTDDELQFLLTLLPGRCRRRMEGERQLDRLPVDRPNPEEELLRAADRPDPRRVAAALAALPAEDRRLLGLRFVRGLRLREIATAQRIDSRQIYRRFEKTLRHIRAQVCPAPPRRARRRQPAGSPRERPAAGGAAA